jgi:hypothetical protein
VSAQHLEIGSGLRLPLSAVTQTTSILGKRGVGKTSLAVVLAEELLEQNLQVVAIDPVGVWWGLRSSADGKRAGHAILVLGGEHGDLPLEPASGRLVADFVVAKAASVVLDVGEFSKTDQARFVADFLERLYQKNRTPLHLIIDEADAFAPQRVHAGIARCFGAVDTAVRRGRARGLGVTLVTQRSAAINKDVLTQTEVLVAFRTLAPQDRAAIEAWIEVHADESNTAAKVLASLSTLEVGEAWFWSPAWLKILQRVKVRPRRTFDSSATPEVGRTAQAPRALAPVDLDALRGALSQLVEKAEREDPRKLQAKVAQLERELARGKGTPAPAARTERVEVPTLPSADRRTLERVLTAIGRLETAAERLATDAKAAGDLLNGILRPEMNGTGSEVSTPRARGAAAGPPGPASAPRAGAPARPQAPRPVARAGAGAGAPQLDKAERAILTVLAQHQHQAGCTLERLAILAGYAPSGGGFRNALSSLRQAELLEGSNTGTMRITDAGLDALDGEWDELPSGDALVEYWLSHRALGAAERAILRCLVDAAPDGLELTKIAARANYAPDGGGFRNALSRLRTMGLLEGRNSDFMRASSHLTGSRSGAA